MKLRIMNCKNCNAHLRLQDDKLVCDFCNSVFDIEKDESDVEYEKTVNAEEYILRSLQDKTAQLQEFYQKEEQKKIEMEEKRDREIKERRREARRKARIHLIKECIMVLLIVGISFIAVKYLRSKYLNEDNLRGGNQNQTTETRPKTYRVTKSQLLDDKKFLDKADEMAFEFEREEHEGAVILSSDEIWNMTSDPEVLERYLVTSDASNGIYEFLQVTMDAGDGRTLVGYVCVVIPNILVDEDGQVYQEDHALTRVQEPADFDYTWKMSFDYEVLKDEVLTEIKKDAERNYFVFEL